MQGKRQVMHCYIVRLGWSATDTVMDVIVTSQKPTFAHPFQYRPVHRPTKGITG